MLSFIALESPPKVAVEPEGLPGKCLALERIRLSAEGMKLTLAPTEFTRFARDVRVGGAAKCSGGWEDAVGKVLAVSVLVHAKGKVLVLWRKSGLAVQSGKCTASVTGTVEMGDARERDVLTAAALRELWEETGLLGSDGALTFRGLVLAPGKVQPVGLFEFSCRDETLRSVPAWPRFKEEHEKAEILNHGEALDCPLSPVSRFAVGLFRHNQIRAGSDREHIIAPLLSDNY